MEKIKLEVWKSSENNEERHYFVSGTAAEIYVLGYNPALFTEAEIEAFLAHRGLKVGE